MAGCSLDVDSAREDTLPDAWGVNQGEILGELLAGERVEPQRRICSWVQQQEDEIPVIPVGETHTRLNHPSEGPLNHGHLAVSYEEMAVRAREGIG